VPWTAACLDELLRDVDKYGEEPLNRIFSSFKNVTIRDNYDTDEKLRLAWKVIFLATLHDFQQSLSVC
jgi:hypothetical protein